MILATGHFTGNLELLKKYTPRLLEPGITRQYTPYDDGAGHQLGAAAGGELLHMDGALITSPFYPPEQLIKGILVNRLGQRFVAEDSYHSRSSIFATQQPGGEAYLIVDEKIFARPLFGHEVVDAWESVAEMERGLAHAGGLAPEDAARLQRARRARRGPRVPQEGQVGGADRAAAVRGDPVLARQVRLHGLHARWPARVGRRRGAARDGSAIAGLYAAGACAANIAQDGAGYSSGTCIGESSFFGRRAGRHAAQARSLGWDSRRAARIKAAVRTRSR